MERNLIFVLLALALVTVTPRLLFWNINQGYWWDEAVYLGLSRNLLENGQYWINMPGQESFRPFLFPVLIAGMWSITGLSEPLAYALPPLFGILSVALLYWMVRKLYPDNRELAIWAALGLATSHMFLFYGQKMLTETMFVFLGTASMLAIYHGWEKDRRLLPLAGLLVGLSFLTRYAGGLFGLLFILYPIIMARSDRSKRLAHLDMLKRNLLDTLGNWGFWLGLAAMLLVVAPWVALNLDVFGSPFGALEVGYGTVTSQYFISEWFFYFTHWIEVFGFLGVFMVPGFVYLVLNRDNPNRMLLIMLAASLLFFMYTPRKEARYLLHFMGVYMTVIGIGIWSLRKWLKSHMVIPLISVLFIYLSFVAGVQMVLNDADAGTSLKSAGKYIASLDPEGPVMTQNMPVVYYTTGHEVAYFPEEPGQMQRLIENRSVSYILIEAGEPTYPAWVWTTDNGRKVPSAFWDDYELLRTYEEWNTTWVWVYRA